MAVKDVVLELGGESRVLRCDLAAWAAVEDHGGRKFLDLLPTFGLGMSFQDLRVMLWAMLGGPDGPPIKEVGHWVTGANLTPVLLKMGEAIRDAFPKEAANPPVASGANGTGSSPDPTPLALDSSPMTSGA